MKRFLLLTSALLFLVPFVAKAQDAAEGRALPGPYNISDEIEISRGEFYLNGRELSDQEISRYIGKEIYERTYAPAIKQRRAGLALCIVGGITTGLGGITAGISGIVALANRNTSGPRTWEQDGSGRMRYENNSYNSATSAFLAGAAVCTAGSVMLSAGIPLLVIGQKRLNWVEEDTRDKLSQKASLSLNSSGNGFGLCLAF